MYLTQALHKAARTTPNHLATLCGQRQQTFSQMQQRVAKLAAGLFAQGLRAGDRVSILALNSDYYFEAILATLWAGGVANPLNIRWVDPELIYVVEDAAPKILLADAEYWATACALKNKQKWAAELFFLGGCDSQADIISSEQLIAQYEPASDACCWGDDLALLLYTSGTTGFPKGVMLSHANLHCAAVGQSAVGCGTRGGRYLNVAPMFHMANLQLMFNHYVAGRSQVFIDRFTPKDFMGAVATYQISDVLLVPTMTQILMPMI